MTEQVFRNTSERSLRGDGTEQSVPRGVPCSLASPGGGNNPSQLPLDFDHPGLDWREATVLEIFGPWDDPGKARP